MSELLKDPTFFYSIAFVLFLILAYSKGKKPFLGWLDSEIQKIRSELEQAHALRTESEATLAEYKSKQTEALNQVEAIIAHAKQEAAQLKAQAEADLKSVLERHEQQAMDRIRLVETEALAAVRKSLVDMAVNTARNALSVQMDEATATRLVDQAISDIPTSPAHKAKAA